MHGATIKTVNAVLRKEKRGSFREIHEFAVRAK
jgi:hypothetical protein